MVYRSKENIRQKKMFRFMSLNESDPFLGEISVSVSYHDKADFI